MLTNAKVGTKLLALIIAPLMVLLAVASLGARDRLDEASDAERIRDVAALTALTEMDERKGKVVELRFFGGLSVEETAEVLEVSPQTVMRDWRLAKAWLLREISRSAASSPGRSDEGPREPPSRRRRPARRVSGPAWWSGVRP